MDLCPNAGNCSVRTTTHLLGTLKSLMSKRNIAISGYATIAFTNKAAHSTARCVKQYKEAQ
jgi:hypothetical protein